jgi:hypothetical protein
MIGFAGVHVAVTRSARVAPELTHHPADVNSDSDTLLFALWRHGTGGGRRQELARGVGVVCAWSATASRRARRRYDTHVQQFEAEARDSLQESLQGALIWQFGAKRGRARAHADVAVVERTAQRGTRLSDEGDLVRS